MGDASGLGVFLVSRAVHVNCFLLMTSAYSKKVARVTWSFPPVLLLGRGREARKQGGFPRRGDQGENGRGK
jgi:hypothetical protein